VAFEHEQRQALHMLEGIENGTMNARESYDLLMEADPTLVHFIVTWLRERYANHPAAEGVIGRLVTLCNEFPAIPKRAKSGASDPIVAWFEDDYAYRDFDARSFIALVVEKLEG
jgi:hypothetical protein